LGTEIERESSQRSRGCRVKEITMKVNGYPNKTNTLEELAIDFV